MAVRELAGLGWIRDLQAQRFINIITGQVINDYDVVSGWPADTNIEQCFEKLAEADRLAALCWEMDHQQALDMRIPHG